MVGFFTQETPFLFKKKPFVRKWLAFVAGSEMKKLGDIGIIFCSDPVILDMNLKYLQHDYFTDIITFDYSEGDTLSGDLFISVDTVKDNAEFYGATFEDELDRVIVHGVLHLIGYDDLTEEQQAVMRVKENYYLSQRDNIR